MRVGIMAAIFSLFLVVISPPLAAQNNPMPFVNNPLVPGAVVPGGPEFTLTVNGAGFVSGAVVNWNGNARATNFVKDTQLTASILASDIATAASVVVTVSNPSPGGGVSNAVIFEVTVPITSLAFTRSDTAFNEEDASTIGEPTGMAVGYSPVNNALSLAVSNRDCTAIDNCLPNNSVILVLSGNEVNNAYTGFGLDSVVTGDFNGDGILDLLALQGNSISVSSGDSNGNFEAGKEDPLPSGALGDTPAIGDFNRDGHLDLALAGYSTMYFLPGNGDGTFGSAAPYSTGAPAGSTQLAAGDFSGDGILDLAVTNAMGNSVSIFLGNGDGTFQTHVDYPTGSSPGAIVTGDFNGDGKLDLAIMNSADETVSILLGNGDGTFQPKVDYPAGVSIISLTPGDYNGDGILDIAVSDEQCTNTGCATSGSVNVLLGNGDGTFQSQLNFLAGALPQSIASGDFTPTSPPAGRSGFAVANYQSNTVSVFTPLASSGGSGSTNPLPTISTTSPTYAIQSSGAFTLTVNGTNFVSSSQVFFGTHAEPTILISGTQLTAAIPANAVAAAGPVSVYVFNPGPGGGNSTSYAFPVYLPPPTISSISPSSVVVGSPGFTLTINGANFVPDSTLNFNGATRAVTYVSSTQMTTTVLTTDVANQGPITMSISNTLGGDGAGGGNSLPTTLTVLSSNSEPTVGGLIPASITAGGQQFTLTITGTGFGPSSIVTFGSSTVSSAYVNPTQLSAAIPAIAIAAAGTPFVTVSNGGNPSIVTTFTINNPVPTASSLAPASVAPGSPALSLSVTGTNFNTTSGVLVNGASRVTTLVNSATLSATLLASDLTHSGTLNVTVKNPTPGGGTTGALPVIVADYNLTTSAASNSIVAGSLATFTFTVAPSNGTLGGPVTFSTSPLPANTSATFSPPSVQSGSVSTNVTLSIMTTPHSALTKMLLPRRIWPHPLSVFEIGLAIFAMGLGLWTATGRARRFAPHFLILVLLLLATGLTACQQTGGSYTEQLNPTTGTPAGTYQIVVTATSGGASLNTTFTLMVN